VLGGAAHVLALPSGHGAILENTPSCRTNPVEQCGGEMIGR
jgi:hypothetical protein